MRFRFPGGRALVAILVLALCTLPLCAPAPAQKAGPELRPVELPGATAPAPAFARDIPGDGIAESNYVMRPFGQVNVFRPQGNPRGVVLVLSGDGGWSPVEVAMSRALAAKGMLVGGVSTTALMKALEASKGSKCVNPNYPLIDLSQDLQHRMGVRAYMKPILFGWSSGATVAYAALAQWPNAGYQAVASLGFSADLPGVKPWCKAPGFAYRPIAKPEKGWLFSPNPQVKVPWIVLQGQQDQVVSPAAARSFALKVPTAHLIELPRVGHGFAMQNQWLPQFMTTLDPMLARAAPQEDAALPAGLPLTIVPARPGTATRNADTMAVLYSGDGGWVGLDRDVAGQLAAAGIPVVGMDSLSYFWSARTPRGAGADLSRIVSRFSARWHRPRVLLVGYSFGADVMPYMIANMAPAARARIAGVTLLGLSPSADFQFHLTSWLDISSGDSLPTVPAVARLSGLPVRCVRGAQESDSACAALPRNSATVVVVPGGHHFDRNAPLLARIILGGQTPAATRT
jgi:type IV secretory pathway VirJ component